jgi:peroxiredoxin family protein
VDATIEKVSIIVSKGSLEGIYPALIMASGAPAEGIEANLFFTFFGLDAVTRKRHEHIRAANGHPSLHLAAIVGSLSGMPGLMTSYLGHKMPRLDVSSIPDFMPGEFLLSESRLAAAGPGRARPGPARPLPRARSGRSGSRSARAAS